MIGIAFAEIMGKKSKKRECDLFNAVRSTERKLAAAKKVRLKNPNI